jgi:hypothetical protein
MSDEKTVRIRIPQPAKIKSDGGGRSVWNDPIDTIEFELVSTQMLRTMLDSKDDKQLKAIEDIADTGEQGVLARNAGNGAFEIIDDIDLQAILDSDPGLPKVSRPSDITLVPLAEDAESAGEELSLVSTQALRKVLGKPPEKDAKPKVELKPGGGFDPYNSS